MSATEKLSIVLSGRGNAIHNPLRFFAVEGRVETDVSQVR